MKRISYANWGKTNIGNATRFRNHTGRLVLMRRCRGRGLHLQTKINKKKGEKKTRPFHGNAKLYCAAKVNIKKKNNAKVQIWL